LAYARSTAEAMGPDVAERIDWVEADLATWTPPADGYDLVVCLYVHVAGSVEEMVQRMAAGVRSRRDPVPGRPIARSTRPPAPETAAAGQVQVSLEAAFAALDPATGSRSSADERPRPMAGTGVDAVIRARRIAT
jgi:hypothetical protein